MHRSVAATCGGFVLASAFVLGGRVGHRASAHGVMDSWSVSPAGEFVYVSGIGGGWPPAWFPGAARWHRGASAAGPRERPRCAAFGRTGSAARGEFQRIPLRRQKLPGHERGVPHPLSQRPSNPSHCVAVNDPSRRAVVAGGGPSSTGPFSPAIRVGDRLFLAGTLGRGPGGYARGNAEAQARQTLDNILGTLRAAEMSFDDVVDVVVWVSDIRQAEAVERIVREAAPNRPITIVGSALMSTAALVEIMMTAER